MVDEKRWSSRPWASRAVKVATFATPLAMSVAATIAVSHVVEPPASFVARLAWWVALSALATVVLVGVDRVSRRLLPLSALLGLSLVFPDEAPSRFRTAIRSGTVRQLERQIEQARAEGLGEDEGSAARRLVELVGALSLHDRLTRGHSERVRAYTKLIATELHFSDPEVDRLQWAGLAHDVGKLFVAAEILNKPGTLTDAEYEEVQRHAAWGAELVEPLRGWLGDAIDGVGQHHERWDGRGYPQGLAGSEISRAGRMIAVADVFDVITSVRSYKKASAVLAAREELVRCSGTQFDPTMVRAFLNVGLGRLRMMVGPLSWLAQLPVAGRVPIGPAAGAAAGGIAAGVALLLGGVVPSDEPIGSAAAAAAPIEPAQAEVVEVVEVDLVPEPVAVTAPEVVTEETPRPVPAGTRFADPPQRTPPPPTRPPTPPTDPPTPPPTTDPAPPPPPPPPPPVRPSAADDVVSVDEDRSVSVDVLTNDRAGSGGPIRLVGVDPSSQGATAIVGDQVRFTPLADTNGTMTLRYEIEDELGQAAAASVIVTVAAVNDAPSFSAGVDPDVSEDSGAFVSSGWASSLQGGPADEDQTLSFVVTATDDTLFEVAPWVDGAGTLRFTPAADANGSTSVSIEAFDSSGLGSGAQTFAITIQPVNDAPRAQPESYQTDAGVQLVVAAPGVLANDSDPDGDVLVVQTVAASGPANGTVTLRDDGGFTYTPNALFIGLDRFTYVLDDGSGGTDTAIVEVFVDSTLLPQGLYLGVGSATSNRWPLRGTPLPPAGPIEPDHDLDRAPGLTLVDSDQKLTNPDPTRSQHWTLAPTAPLALRGPVSLDLWSTVAGFDDDKDMDYSAWLLDCAPDGTDCTVITSALDVHIDEWNRGFRGWVHKTLSLGSADHVVFPGRTLELRLMVDHDDAWIAMSGTRASRLDLTLGNATPMANDDAYTVLEDSTANPFRVLDNDVDSDLVPSSVTVLSGPSKGTATPRPDGVIEYTPDPDANGPDTFTYRVCDLGLGCASATVTIAVTAVNDAPSFVRGPPIVVPADSGSHRFDLWATSISAGPVDENSQSISFVVTNDANSLFAGQPTIDEDGDLEFEIVDGATGQATVTAVIVDDGGTASGGVAVGTTVVFTIDIA